MIGIYAGTAGVAGGTTRLAMTYNGLTLNSPSDTLGGATGPDTYEINTVAGLTAFDYLSEINQQRDGLEVYPFRKVSRIVTLRGIIRAPSVAKLHDKIKALANAFDPAKIGHDNASNPFLAFDFDVPTTDTANYATGLVPSRYYALPMRVPDPVIDYAVGYTASFDIVLLMRDPRRYLQTAATQVGAATIANSKADYRSWPTLTITMAGAGSAAYAYTNNPALAGIATSTLTLDLSGMALNDVVVVDMERRTITKNGTATPSLYVSGNYFEIEPGDNVVSIANATNATSSLSFRPAFSI